MSQRKKTLLVGLDAAGWDYVNPLLADDQLPALARLMADGASGVLQSTMPALTPVAWSSIITGKNPGKHGVFDMTARRPGSYDFVPVNAQKRLGTPFWTRLNEAGVRVGLVNVPFTYPPDAVDGFVVVGFGAPGSVPALAYPREALAWIESEYGRYVPNVDSSLLRSGRHDAIFAAEQELQSRQVDIALGLAEKYEVDVLVINLMILDHINHKAPDLADVHNAIRQLDQDLQRLVAGFQPDNVMAISDHGARRVKGDFLLHVWLREQGYSVQAERPLADRDDAENWVVKEWLQNHHGWHGTQERLARAAIRRLLPLLPAGRRQAFWQRVEASVPFAVNHIARQEQLAFDQTRLYPGASYSSILYVNRQGREPQGNVPAAEQARLAAEVRDKLLQLVDPETGAPLFSAVYTADSLYDGPFQEHAPDIVIDSYDSEWNVLSTFRRGPRVEALRDRYFVENLSDFGHHSRDGIVVCAGTDFATGRENIEGHVMDVPATLLRLYDVAIPEDLDGQPLDALLDPQFLQTHPLRTQPGDDITAVVVDDLYSEAETEEIVSHLRALGYVD